MRKNDWKIAAILAVIAAVLYWLLGTTGYFPGESARLTVVLKGLEPARTGAHPLFAFLGRITGAGSFIPWLSGVLSVAALYLLVTCFIRFRFDVKSPAINRAVFLSRLGGSVAAAVLMFSPAMIDSATRLSPGAFDLLLAVLTLLALVRFYMSTISVGKWWVLSLAVLTVVGLVESPSFFWLTPLIALALYFSARRRRGAFPWRELTIYVLSVFFIYLFAAAKFGDGPVILLKRAIMFISNCRGVKGWMFPLLFVAMPSLLLVHATKRALGEGDGRAAVYSHLGFTLLIAIGTFSTITPYGIMSPAGVVPTFVTALGAFGAGYLVVWWMINMPLVRKGVLALFGVLFAITAAMTVVDFNPRRGEWADKTAERILADLDGRTWLVSDGLLDDHLVLAAAARGSKIHLVSLRRDLDPDYLSRLAAEVAASGIGGPRNSELELAVRLGVLPFVKSLLALPDAGATTALFANPDLWYGSGREPVPEFLLVGSDRTGNVDDSMYLEAPSSMLDNPVIARRLSLCANNRGVYLEDHQQPDAAWAAYRRALQLWPDNLSALMNCYGMARSGYSAAAPHLKTYENRLAEIAADGKRRYDVWKLSSVCGYIRNAEAYVRIGYDWARSGRVGEALSYLSRAVDLAPDARVNLMNMMAALYAQDRDARNSREVYRKILAEDAANHDALIGMMRLELAEGKPELAAGYLERAAAVSGGRDVGEVERAVSLFVRGERAEAEELLKKATLAQGADARTWSLRAATVLAELETAREPKERRRLREKLEVEILRPMSAVAVGNDHYYYLVVRAFADMNGNDQERKEARDALSKAALMRPSARDIHEKLIALDISLADVKAAESHARNALRIDPSISVANYALGSIALSGGDLATAEGFLRKAVDVADPSVLAINDLAETCRRRKNYSDAVGYAVRATEIAPQMCEVWDTLALTLLESGGDLDRAEAAAAKSVELSKKNGKVDLRSLFTLSRVQLKRGEVDEARKTINRILQRKSELDDAGRAELEELRKNVR